MRGRAAIVALLAMVTVACGGDDDGYRGLVTDVSDDRITVDGPEGPRTFSYEPGLVPLEHLQHHLDEELPVVIGVDDDDPTRAIAIDDA